MPSDDPVQQAVRLLGGCGSCRVVPLFGAHVCEHGVMPAAADDAAIAVLLRPPPWLELEFDDDE
jgi:hypothetical protein